MTLVIGGVDYSSYIQQLNGIVETPRYVDGTNTGTSINGSLIFDRVTAKYDIVFNLKPMPADMLRGLISACEANQVRIKYTSMLQDNDRTITGQCAISSVRYIKTQNSERIYGECSISITER